jgi:hypothetical protein
MAAANFGWESVAQTVLAASQGRTKGLQTVGGEVPFSTPA